LIGLDFSGGAASVATQLNTALAGAGLQFSGAGTTLEVLDTGTGTTVNAASTTTTATTLTGGSGALPLFVDGASPYTGVITGTGSEVIGFAGRISVNQSLLDDPSGMIAYSASTPQGDATRPNFIYDRLANGTHQYSSSTGLGSPGNPYQGTLSNYLSQVVNMQSTAANNAANLQSGQDVVVNALQARFNTKSAVSIDTEMTNLLTLQNTYGANARVVSTVKAMLDTLMQMM
jgi:flagellar hook-associated protein 1 FlgK